MNGHSTIYKYTMWGAVCHVAMPQGAQLLTVSVQADNEIVVWAAAGAYMGRVPVGAYMGRVPIAASTRLTKGR